MCYLPIFSTVLNSPQCSGYIDLSKRRVSPEDITKCEERYMKSKTVASIMRHVASKLPASGSLEAAPVAAPPAEVAEAPAGEAGEKESKKSRRARQAAAEDDGEDVVGGANEEERLEKLYDAVGWPLGKKYGHTYDAFKLSLTYVHLLFAAKSRTNSPLENPTPSTSLSLCRYQKPHATYSCPPSHDA